MTQMIFVNMQVSDLKKSMSFFKELGYDFNLNFTDEKTAACLVISDTIFAMLHTPDSFKGFLTKPASDPHKATEVLLALNLDNRADVDRYVDKALSLGATVARPPEDLGFMYTRSYNDLDGHVWEICWLDPAVASGEKAPG